VLRRLPRVRVEVERDPRRPRRPPVIAAALITAGLLAGGGLSFGALQGGGQDSARSLHACYNARTGAARIVGANRRCRRGERRTTWARVGQVGAAGLPGAPGANGPGGANGAAGATGPTGPQGLQGQQGDRGDQGDPGVEAFNDLSGLPCTRSPGQDGAIALTWGTGGVPTLRCRLATDGAICGDGVTETGETCDDGNTNPHDDCTNSCQATACGDSIVKVTGADAEQCDSGGNNSPTCDSNCTVASCGDAHVNSASGEQCDSGGNDATCDDDCTAVVCGDGRVNPVAGEECDDGNFVDNGNGCSASCKLN
jgi:cysteine-rich repeat protein